MAENRVIGRDNQLPWRLPADLRHFRRLTLGKPVVMGRRTYESLGQPLPKRENWILTRQADFTASGCRVARSVDEILALSAPELAVIGGQQVYELFLPLASRMELTVVHAEVEGDAWFPPFTGWRLHAEARHCADAEHAFDYTFQTWLRVPVE